MSQPEPDPSVPSAPPERWTPDDVVVRDASGEVGARAFADEHLGRFADELRALGFAPLAVLGLRFVDGADGLEEVSDDELAELEAAEAAGDDPRAAARLEAARQQRHLWEMHERDHFAWAWCHPDTHDLAEVEHNEHGDWLTFSRLHEDGALVRTMRRPEGMPEGAPELTGAFIDAPVPGLYALICRLAGDGFACGLNPKPGVRQWDEVIPSVPPAQAWERHRARVAGLALSHDGVPPTPGLAVALSRRTLHVTHAGLERVDRVARRVRLVVATVGWFGVLRLLGEGTGSWAHALGLALLVAWLTTTLWVIGVGASAPAAVLLPLAVVLLAAWAAEVAPAVLAAAVAVSLAGVVAARLAYLWVGQGGRVFVDRRLASPPPVAAAELERVYRR